MRTLKSTMLLALIGLAATGPSARAADVDVTKNRDVHLQVWNTLFGTKVGDPIYDADLPAGHRAQVNGAWWATDTATKQRFLNAQGQVRTADHSVAAIIPDGSGGFTMPQLDSWLSSNVGSNRIAFTDLMNENTDIKVAIDLSAWNAAGAPSPLPFGSVISVVNGLSSALPGYQIGTSDMSFSTASGWVNPAPYTGDVVSFGEIGIQYAVPEPAALACLLIAALVFRVRTG